MTARLGGGAEFTADRMSVTRLCEIVNLGRPMEGKYKRKSFIKVHFCSITKYLAIDCEMDQIDGQSDASLVCKVTIINSDGQIVLDTLVDYNLPKRSKRSSQPSASESPALENKDCGKKLKRTH